MKRGVLKTNSLRAIFASDPTRSRGRHYASDDSPTRSEFQRDRDRIIHSTAFRRLQYKTQVFLHHEGSHFRTRLTHTLEVSQIARSIARALNVDEDLAEAVALAHDLGHPPFGHAGERVLNEKMQKWGGFDHNLQAFRTVTKLENRYAEHDGLNLTWESLEGILKHNGPLHGEVPAKLAFLECNSHAGLEAQIAAIADDIAYNAHDIDDALRAGIIDLEQLRNVALVGPIVDEVLSKWPDIGAGRKAHEVQRRLITRTIEDVIATSRANIVELDPQSVKDIRQAGRTIIEFSTGLASVERLLKQFLFENVYRSPKVLTHVKKGEAVVGVLFDALMKERDLPDDWQAKLKGADSERKKARIICDFIAGMTDPYALDLYQRLFDERPKFS